MNTRKWLRLRPSSSILPAFLLVLAVVPGVRATASDCPVPIVVRDATGQPLPDAEVVVSPGDQRLTPDADGVVCVEGLAAGTYEVGARRPGFADVHSVLSVPSTGALELVLRPAREELVVVTGTRADRELRSVPYSISVIDRRQIEASGADSAGELLRDVPGVQVTDTSLAGNKRVRIRGEVGSNVLVLVDGREISEQRSFHGAAPLLLDLADVDRVELVRGPSSVVYGSKAIGGTVNFISRPPADQKIAGRASLTLNSSTRGYDGGGSFSGTLDWFDYRLSASRSDHGDRRVPDAVEDNAAYTDAVGRLESSAFDSDYLTAEVGRRWGGSRLAFRVEDFQSEIESHTSNDVLASGLDSFQLALPRQDRRTFAATYRAAGLSPHLPSLSATAYLQRRNRDFDQTLGIREPDFAGPGSLLEVDLALETVYEQDTAGLLASVEWTPARAHRVVAGLDVVRDTMDSTVSDVTTTTLTFPRLPRPIVDVATENPVNESRQDSVGVFLQDEWSLAHRLKLVLGARYNTFESALLTTTSPNLETGSTRNGKLSGAASLLYEPTSGSAVRASYSQGYRNPSLLELYEGTAHGGGGLLYPNPGLSPEKSDNFEVGARLATSGLSIDASAFYTRARDYVTTRLCAEGAPCPTGAVPGVDRVYDNVNGARTRGVELAATWRFDSLPLELFGEATYLQREFDYTDFTTSDTGLPRLWGRGGLRVGRSRSQERGFFAELSARAASEADEEVTPGTLEHYPGWATVSARGGIDFGSSRVPVALTVEVGNILDKAFRPAQESLYQPGRHLLAKIATRF